MLRSTGQQPGRKSVSRPGNKSVMNRLSIAGFFLPSVYIGIRLFVFPIACSCFRENVATTCLRCFEGYGKGLFPRLTVLFLPDFAQSDPKGVSMEEV